MSMDSKHGNNIVDVDGDRLSSLPDDLIHTILSFIGIKDAVKTSVLSSRWRHTWASIRHLNFSTEDFHKSTKFSKVVEHVFSHRNHLMDMLSVKLVFTVEQHSFGWEVPTPLFVERILNYASSHNVQHLSVTCTRCPYNFALPLSLFSSQSLKHLILTCPHDKIFRSIWELPALTTLCLCNLGLYNDTSEIFSNCPNLKSLTLKSCTGTGGIDIYHSQLLNLTLEDMHTDVYVEAPQLKTLTVSICLRDCSLKFSGDVPFLEKVDMCIITNGRVSDACKVAGLFEQFHGVKFLTLNLEFVELLSSYVSVCSHGSSPFSNLESLAIYPIGKYLDGTLKTDADVYSFVKKYFLHNSPNVTLTMVLREEMRVRESMQMILMQWEADTHNQMNVEWQRVLKERRWQLQFGESTETFWKDFYKLFEIGDTEAHGVVSMSRWIEPLLKKLPTLKRDKMQSMYPSLSALHSI